jgi:hypothetical protein
LAARLGKWDNTADKTAGKANRGSQVRIQKAMDNQAIFGEKYRVIAIDDQNLVLQGIRTGDVLTIKNADPQNPLTKEDYPPGKIIVLNDPSKGVQS